MIAPARRVWLSSSTGKDGAWALALRTEVAWCGLEVVGLLTTFNEAHARVAMRAVRRELERDL